MPLVFACIAPHGGALRGQGWRGEMLSYEAPTYFGMLCASYRRS